jgi:hypothetical protein
MKAATLLWFERFEQQVMISMPAAELLPGLDDAAVMSLALREPTLERPCRMPW